MKKQVIQIWIITAIIIIFFLSASYAFLTLRESNNSATGTGGCFEVNYSGQVINNSSLIATTNYLEGASSNVVLSKKNGCDIYTEADIMIYTNSTTTAPIENYKALKYKVLKDSTVVNEGIITAQGATKLATVSLTTTATTYKVYLWIDPTISLGYYNDKTYSGYLYATAIQTSTVK